MTSTVCFVLCGQNRKGPLLAQSPWHPAGVDSGARIGGGGGLAGDRAEGRTWSLSTLGPAVGSRSTAKAQPVRAGFQPWPELSVLSARKPDREGRTRVTVGT